MKVYPLVSICIPSYNSAQFIKQTIESVLSQSYPNIELIISDDCSTDSTTEIIRSFSDNRILFHQQERNLGVEGNWNSALRLASGTYIKMMGADDLLLPTCIDDQVTVLEHPDNFDVALVSSHKRVIDQDGETLISIRFPGKEKINGLAALKMSVRRGNNIIGEPVAGLFRSSVLQKSGLYNGDNIYMIDLDLWSRILKHGSLYIIDKTLFCFRISRGSISASLGIRQFTLFNDFTSKLAAEKSFKITRTDKIIGTIMCLAKTIARQAFHRGLILTRKF